MIARFDVEDMQLLSGLLEQEKRRRKTTSLVCLMLFVVSFVFFLGALALVGYILAAGGLDELQDSSLSLFNSVGAISGAMMLSFTFWHSAQNCIHSIDRSLVAAKAGRVELFAGFVRNIDCMSKKNRGVLLEAAGSFFV